MRDLKNMFGYDENWKERNYNDKGVLYKNIASEGKECNCYIVFDEAIPRANTKSAPLAPRITFKPTKVIANDNAVIVFFADDTKNVMKLAKGEKYDIETAVAYAIAQKVYGSNSAFKKSVAKILADLTTKEIKVSDEVVDIEKKSSLERELTPDVEEKIVKTLLNTGGNKKNTVKNRGRKPCMKCTVTDEGIKNNPSLAVLRGLVLDINKKLKDDLRTVVVYKNGVRYELTRGEYKLNHGEKGWNAGDRSKGYGTNKGRTN